VIVGQRDFECQDVESILACFGDELGKARTEYFHFLAAGFNQGRREGLGGSGFILSERGTDKFAKSKDGEDDPPVDYRILGSGEFVEQILLENNQYQIKKEKECEDILDEVCRKWDISKEEILSRTKIRRVTRPRREFFLRAQEEAGESMASLARLCGLAHTSVREAIEKARQERDEDRKPSKPTNVP